MSWFLYILECADASLYTGITTDLERRVDEHNKGPRGARYTRSRRPVTLVAAWSFSDRGTAASAEYAMKQLPRSAKLDLVTQGEFAGGCRVSL